ncbi:SdiA-regulated domain-containing protein [Pontibacter sp. Tf4]|uniref:SdiA-regulated domain-containing protein n=1 Tax=Pontibacter sp. Tf4 TaxID=2761620 RepID=UPI001627C239|nr:SdiA-regulated domain-containing protein [Pontibacter sp. Tf4]MBB6611084.1 SdiA-regulated domain-containing protein [Pontibacter sp. Tf4]
MKLMTKVFILFAAVLAVAFYFLRDQFSDAPAAAPASSGNLERLASLPGEVKESSGIETLPEKGHLITHNDAGNKPYLYEINEQGKLLKTYKLKLPNVDWEDLTRDDKGNLYISDTGNNDNKRRELAVYKVNYNAMNSPQAIRFTYEDQPHKTSKKDKIGFDSEAIFWYNNTLYLVTKDRSNTGEARIYTLPDTPGTHKAQKAGTLKLKEPVTGAAISPDASIVALLSEEKIHLYRDVPSPEKFYEQKAEEIKLDGAGQTEGITFEDAKTLLITSEGGNLYRYKL